MFEYSIARQEVMPLWSREMTSRSYNSILANLIDDNPEAVYLRTEKWRRYIYLSKRICRVVLIYLDNSVGSIGQLNLVTVTGVDRDETDSSEL